MSSLQEDGTVRTSPGTRPRRRVLISAFAVSPVRGSECGIGWNIGSRVAKYHDVTLMCIPGTFDPHRQEIETYLKEHPVPGLTMLYIESPPIYTLLDRKSSSILRPLLYIGYAKWQRDAYRKVREIHAEKPFELTHHLNILGFREPGYLWKLPIPFFWGPVAGASNMPWKYFGMLSWRDKIAYGARNIANEIQKRTFPRPRKAARAAAKIWAIGEDNRRMFTDVFHVPAECLCEAGGKPRPQLASIKKYDPQKEPLRLVWAGYHIGRKGVPLMLGAIAKVKDEFPIEFTVLGSGPENLKWKAIADKLGISKNVNWIAELPQAQAHEKMSAAHVFAFPSLQEASSTVTLEALSLGLPVICHDACGMAFIVNNECGIKVPMVSPQLSVAGFADALRFFHNNPAEMEKLSRGALKRSEELSWDYAAEQIALGYDQILAGAGK